MEVNLHQRLVNVWSKFESLLSDCHDKFFPPATEDRITAFESELKVRLPDDYRLSLMIHEWANGLWGSVILSDLIESKKFWRDFIETASDYRYVGGTLEASGPVRNDLFNAEWIPVAYDNDIPICIDMNPMPHGVIGQIIYLDWECGTVKVIHDSFIEFLEDGVHKLEAEQNNKSAVGVIELSEWILAYEQAEQRHFRPPPTILD